MKHFVVYEVIKDCPYGPVSLDLFFSESAAMAYCETWNVKNSDEKAYVRIRKVRRR